MKNFKERKEVKQHTGSSKLISAIAMLLVSVVLLTGVSYAWLVLSVAPEVRGITTQIASNGSLEIALLNKDTYMDTSKIGSVVGASASTNTVAANLTWGNLVDVNDSSYGLSEIKLLPSRVNIEEVKDTGFRLKGGTPASNVLLIPTYDYDGRVVGLSSKTVSAIFSSANNSFIKNGTDQDFGIRAIGTSPNVTAQGSALALAKNNVATSTSKAALVPSNVMSDNADKLILLVSGSEPYDNDDVAILSNMIKDLDEVNDHIDNAIRYGILAYAAKSISDTTLFEQARNLIESDASIEDILSTAEEIASFPTPSGIKTWLTEANAIKTKINNAKVECAKLTDGSYTKAEIRGVLDILIDFNKVYINNAPYSSMSSSDLAALMGSKITMDLYEGSGVFADIANFTGKYGSQITVMGSSASFAAYPKADTNYLVILQENIKDFSPAGDSTVAVVEITDTYGYAIDMAFRCNAALPDLLLQTEAIQRINEDSASPSTAGGGSYMEFSTNDTSLTTEQTLQLLDAVRVAFVDDTGSILGIAKLNLSNYEMTDGIIKAPLYLYGFTLEDDPISKGTILVMDERRKESNLITNLVQNQAKAVTSLVWLDGDLVDNTMVSAESETSLTGTLNLQFSTSADLVPVENSDLLNLIPDKASLNNLIEEKRATYDAGQAFYTTVTWNEFKSAFDNAVKVSENAKSNEAQILAALTKLTDAKLETLELSALKAKIDYYRDFMGSSTDIARYVLENTDMGFYYSLSSYTEEEKDKSAGVIYRVNYEKNLRDDGNGVQDLIYTNESWSALASALYNAEMYYEFNKYTTAAHIDSAITALQTAYDALVPNTYFVAYDYHGELYFKAVYYEDLKNFDPEDSYGTWYDKNKKRITSDLMIIKLDTDTVIADIAKIEGLSDINHTEYGNAPLMPSIDIFDYIYDELKDEDIIAIQWSVDDHFILLRSPYQEATLNELITKAESLGLTTEANAAKLVLTSENISYADTQTAIDTLAPIVVAKEAEKLAAEEAAKPAPDPAVTPMDGAQHTLLTTAISNAKAIEGYDDLEMKDLEKEEKAKFTALRDAVAAAEALLDPEPENYPTMKEADEALTALNTSLTAFGLKEVTIYNTIKYNIPYGSEHGVAVNNYDELGTLIAINKVGVDDKTGTATVKAVVLTKSGVIFTVTEEVDIYAPIESIEFNVAKYEGQNMTWDEALGVTYTHNIKAIIHNSINPETGEPYAKNEDIKKITWSVSDPSSIELTNYNSQTCTIKGLKAGTVTLSVLIETEQGNPYTYSVDVNVR